MASTIVLGPICRQVTNRSTQGKPSVFSHITIGANDVPAANRLYDALFGAMGAESGAATPDGVFTEAIWNTSSS